MTVDREPDGENYTLRLIQSRQLLTSLAPPPSADQWESLEATARFLAVETPTANSAVILERLELCL